VCVCVCVCLGFWVSKETLAFSFVIWEERRGGGEGGSGFVCVVVTCVGSKGRGVLLHVGFF
jgi:hypothetical protein